MRIVEIVDSDYYSSSNAIIQVPDDIDLDVEHKAYENRPKNARAPFQTFAEYLVYEGKAEWADVETFNE